MRAQTPYRTASLSTFIHELITIGVGASRGWRNRSAFPPLGCCDGRNRYRKSCKGSLREWLSVGEWVWNPGSGHHAMGMTKLRTICDGNGMTKLKTSTVSTTIEQLELFRSWKQHEMPLICVKKNTTLMKFHFHKIIALFDESWITIRRRHDRLYQRVTHQ